MNNTTRLLAVLALAGAVFTMAAPAHADTPDGPAAEGHSNIETDVSYNAITQVISFDVKIPTIKADGPGYGE